MKKLIALLLASLLLLSLAACAAQTEPAQSTPADTATTADTSDTASSTQTTAPSGDMTEEDAEAARDAGTLASDPQTGYEYSENTATWYYSNYPNYKDFKADGVVRLHSSVNSPAHGSHRRQTPSARRSRAQAMNICTLTQTPTSRHGSTAFRTSSTRTSTLSL